MDKISRIANSVTVIHLFFNFLLVLMLLIFQKFIAMAKPHFHPIVQ